MRRESQRQIGAGHRRRSGATAVVATPALVIRTVHRHRFLIVRLNRIILDARIRFTRKFLWTGVILQMLHRICLVRGAVDTGVDRPYAAKRCRRAGLFRVDDRCVLRRAVRFTRRLQILIVPVVLLHR